MTITVDVPDYGVVNGIISPAIPDGSVLEFRGVPYGKIPGRFQRPHLVGKLSSPHDGSKYGPMCPSVRIETILGDTILDLIGPAPNQPQDEFECLNLNIAVPKKVVGKIPVLIWIHGGAFVLGANTDRYAAIASLVKESIETNKPIIAVSINYRLNYFGFLAHKDILEANKNHGGGCGNWGLYDQRIAFEWVQKNIAAWGGDPDQVTTIGHSAGSISLHGHLLAGNPSFDRAIMASGVMAGMNGSGTIEDANIAEEYENLTEYLGVTDFEELQKVPVDKLMEAHTKLKARPVSHIIDDSKVEGGFFTLGKEGTKGWICHPNSVGIPIMIGDAGVEGIIFVPTVQKYDPETLLTGLQKRLPASLLRQYKLDAESAPPSSTPMSTILPAMISWCSDVPFSGPTAKVCDEYPGPTYSYHFNRGHQFDGGRPKGIANHGVDMNYVFGGHIPHFASDVDRNISRVALGNVLKFVYGERPWAPRNGRNISMVYGADGKIGVEENDKSRRWEAYQELYKDWENVKKVWSDFLALKL
jgi:carboxylesterase type B